MPYTKINCYLVESEDLVKLQQSITRLNDGDILDYDSRRQLATRLQTILDNSFDRYAIYDYAENTIDLNPQLKKR